MEHLYVDFETYWDSRFTLGSMPMDAYVRDPRCESMGAAVCRDGEDPKFLTPDEVGPYLDSVEWEDTLFVAHNAAFDASVLTMHYGHRPARIACTQSMAALHLSPMQSIRLKDLAELFKLPAKGELITLGKRWADLDDNERGLHRIYTQRDVELCRRLFHKMWSGTVQVERDVIDAVVRMSSEPRIELVVGDDPPESQLATAALDDRTFAGLLRALGVEPPMKQAVLGKMFAFSKEDVEYQQLYRHPEERVRKLMVVRRQAKRDRRTRTWLGSLREAAGRGLWPAQMVYAGSRTGDPTGAVRTMPRKGPERDALRAPAGRCFVVGDFSAIELRLMAVVAGEAGLLEAMEQGRSVYMERAQALYGPGVARESKHYVVGKQSMLSTMYGLGPEQFLHKCRTAWGVGDIGLDEAKAAVWGFRDAHPQIPALWRKADWLLRAMSKPDPDGRERSWSAWPSIRVDGSRPRLILPSGRAIWYDGLDTTPLGWTYRSRSRAERNSPVKGYTARGAQVVQNLMNGMARDVTCLALSRMVELTGHRPVFTNHDELAYVVPVSEGPAFCDELQNVMRTEVDWMPELPVDAEVGYGASYREAK